MVNEKLIDSALAAIKEERALTLVSKKKHRYMVNVSSQLAQKIDKISKAKKWPRAKLILACIKIAIPVLEEELEL